MRTKYCQLLFLYLLTFIFLKCSYQPSTDRIPDSTLVFSPGDTIIDSNNSILKDTSPSLVSKKIPNGKIVYEIPDTMALAINYRVAMIISKISSSNNELIEKHSKLVLLNKLIPEKYRDKIETTIIDTLVLGGNMTVKMQDPDKSFNVTPYGNPTQEINASQDSMAMWQWDINPSCS